MLSFISAFRNCIKFGDARLPWCMSLWKRITSIEHRLFQQSFCIRMFQANYSRNYSRMYEFLDHTSYVLCINACYLLAPARYSVYIILIFKRQNDVFVKHHDPAGSLGQGQDLQSCPQTLTSSANFDP